jgi:hypothetical protein
MKLSSKHPIPFHKYSIHPKCPIVMKRMNIGRLTVNYWMVIPRKEGAMARPKGLGNNVEWARQDALTKAREAVADLTPILEGDPIPAEERMRLCGHANGVIHEVIELLHIMKTGEAPTVRRPSALRKKYRAN